MVASRPALFDEFVRRFADRPPMPVSQTDVDEYEQFLQLQMPSAWVEFVLRHGAVATSTILTMVVDQDLCFPDLQYLGTPAQERETCEAYWPAGMPTNVVSIGSDSSGSVFGFLSESLRTRTSDAPVVFFDHDFNDVTEVAGSFESLLGWYVENLRV